ncbi:MULTISPECIES: amino acid ABC transporter permease [Streptomyces]
MAWDEWEQLKESRGASGSTAVQLDGRPAEAGGGAAGEAGGLRHSAKPWTRAAVTAGHLGTDTGKAKGDLSKGHAGMTAGLTGLASLAELRTVLDSWEKRLDSVRDECRSLEPKLRQVATDLGGVDTATGAKADAVHTPKKSEGR